MFEFQILVSLLSIILGACLFFIPLKLKSFSAQVNQSSFWLDNTVFRWPKTFGITWLLISVSVVFVGPHTLALLLAPIAASVILICRPSLIKRLSSLGNRSIFELSPIVLAHRHLSGVFFLFLGVATLIFTI